MTRNIFKGGRGGKISNSNGVGSQIFMTPHSPRYKLSKKHLFSKIGQVQVVQNQGELIRNSIWGKGGKISNSNGVGSQIFMTTHAPRYKLSKKHSFSKIGLVQVVQNQGELIWNSFCRLTQVTHKVPPKFRPLTLVRF